MDPAMSAEELAGMRTPKQCGERTTSALAYDVDEAPREIAGTYANALNAPSLRKII
jgi:hypothetical protein